MGTVKDKVWHVAVPGDVAGAGRRQSLKQSARGSRHATNREYFYFNVAKCQ